MYINTARFRCIADALYGQGGFRPRVENTATGPVLYGDSYLIQYPREGVDKYARRNQVAWYINDLASACARFAGYLAKRPPLRRTDNPLLAAFIDDCNWRGDALNVFWSSFTMDSKARGTMFLLVDMPNSEQLAQRNIPYLLPIKPENIISIELDARGSVTLCEVITEDGMIHGWDTAGWWVRKGLETCSKGEHSLGKCPVLAFAESEIGRDGEFSQIFDLSRRLFNLHSELDEILRAQTFSLLTYQIPAEQSGLIDVSAIAAEIGTNNMLIHTGQTPTFIAPSEGPASTYMERIKSIEERIKQIGHFIEPSSASQESGIALTLRFQQLNSSLSHFAMRLADLELRVWDLVTSWLGLSFESVSVAWDDDYAIADVKTELEKLSAMQLSGFSAATLTAKRQQIISLDLANMPVEEITALIDSEEEGAHERAIVPENQND